MASGSNIIGDSDPDRPVLRRESTLAIVLGASEWPAFPEFHAAPAFRHSAYRIADYLRDREGLNLSPRNVKVLFDSFDDGPEILRQMWDFIRDRRRDLTTLGSPATDLLLYYVGHGGFSENDAFFLSIRSTSENDPLATSITAESLGRLIREAAAGLRNYLVLDCCFAASVTKVFMNGALGVAEARLRDAMPHQGDSAARSSGRLPAYGTALLCASGPRDPAKVLPGLPYTMFSGGLLDVLRTGDAGAPPWLSLDDAARLVRQRLETQFAGRAVQPVVHAPQQSLGRLDLLPLFPNRARTNLATPPPVLPAKPIGDESIGISLWGNERESAAEAEPAPVDVVAPSPEPAKPPLAPVPVRRSAKLTVWLAGNWIWAWAGAIAVVAAAIAWAWVSLDASSTELTRLAIDAPLTHMPQIAHAAPAHPSPATGSPPARAN
jgi:hypothetical protein